MEPGSKLNVLNLFKKPNKWSSEHLTGLHIEEHDHVSIATILDDVVLLTDDDLCTINLSLFLYFVASVEVTS